MGPKQGQSTRNGACNSLHNSSSNIRWSVASSLETTITTTTRSRNGNRKHQGTPTPNPSFVCLSKLIAFTLSPSALSLRSLHSLGAFVATAAATITIILQTSSNFALFLFHILHSKKKKGNLYVQMPSIKVDIKKGNFNVLVCLFHFHLNCSYPSSSHQSNDNVIATPLNHHRRHYDIGQAQIRNLCRDILDVPIR